MRRTGLGLAIPATVLWLLVVGSILLTPRSDGVPIGAGLLYILGVPLSVAAAVILILSLWAATSGTASPRVPTRTPTDWTAGALAAVSAVLLPVIFVLGSTNSLPGSTLRRLLFLGIGAFVVATALFTILPKQPR